VTDAQPRAWCSAWTRALPRRQRHLHARCSTLEFKVGQRRRQSRHRPPRTRPLHVARRTRPTRPCSTCTAGLRSRPSASTSPCRGRSTRGDSLFAFRHMQAAPSSGSSTSTTRAAPVQPIIPGDNVPVGEQDPTAPTTPVDPISARARRPAHHRNGSVQHCQLTACRTRQPVGVHARIRARRL
jgi:hypothetical protein